MMLFKTDTKVNAIDTSTFVLKTQCITDKWGLEKKFSYTDKKIPDTSWLVKNTDYNAKITEIEGKITNITDIPTTAALHAVDNKLLKISELNKKADYDAKI